MKDIVNQLIMHLIKDTLNYIINLHDIYFIYTIHTVLRGHITQYAVVIWFKIVKTEKNTIEIQLVRPTDLCGKV